MPIKYLLLPLLALLVGESAGMTDGWERALLGFIAGGSTAVGAMYAFYGGVKQERMR